MKSARVEFKRHRGRWPDWKETCGMMLILAHEEGKVSDMSPYVDLILKGSRYTENGKTVGSILYDLRHR
jgi:hypothetical protein